MFNKVEICGVNTSKLPLLSNEEKKQLLIKIKNGDEEARTKMVACTPKEVFTVYDDTVQNRALFSVRYGAHENGVTKYGEVMTRDEIIVFDDGKIKERK